MHFPPGHPTRPNFFSWRHTAFVLAAFVLLLTGCGRFSTLKKEVAQLDSDLYLRGEVTARIVPASPVLVLVFQKPKPDEFAILDCVTLQPGDNVFAFSLPPGGPYYVAAFEDTNKNGRFDAGEPGWMGGAPDPVEFGENRRSPDFKITLRTGLNVPPSVVAGLRAAGRGRSAEELASGHKLPVSLGQIADLKAPRFAREAGSLGLWEPATFLNQHGIGIYFARPYDPKLIPVLLVHGAGGTPHDWIDFAPRLDPHRFQVWFYFYPSGIRLETAGRALESAVATLHERYQFSRLDVVAHSMGGLVSRSYLLQAKHAGHDAWLRNFVTLSTPWGGHEAAALGVEHAPTAIPSWIDMQTNSEFGKKIYEEDLPAGMTYHLVFTFHGSNSMVLPSSNDSSVSVASQLNPPAQAAAKSVHGFDQTHVGVLNFEPAAKWVGSLLLADEQNPAANNAAAPLGR